MSVRKPIRSRVALAAVAIGTAFLAQAQWASAQVASDQEAGYIVFPKVVVDTAGTFNGGRRVDTLIQLTNTDSNPPNASGAPHRFHCFWINNNSCCGAACSAANTTVCDPNAAPACPNNLPCVQSWGEQSNFQVLLTPGQPLAFLASSGQSFVDCDPQHQNNGCASIADGSVSGVGSPFIGELKCVEVSESAATNPPPIARNDLKGEARIYSVTSGAAVGNSVDTRQYSAVGFPVPASVVAGGFNNATPAMVDSLCIGNVSSDPASCPAPEYAACPDTIILNNFFENSSPFGQAGEQVGTTLTLVPCSEDILTATAAAQTPVRVQLAIFNEFEQRFSSTTNVNCYRSTRLADLDTIPGPGDDATSIFAAGVQGTLAGQTRIRGVSSNSDLHGLIGIAEEVYTNAGNTTSFSDAYNLNYQGNRSSGDVVRIQP